MNTSKNGTTQSLNQVIDQYKLRFLPPAGQHPPDTFAHCVCLRWK